MNLRLARHKDTDTIVILDLDNPDFKQDITNDFKGTIISWLKEKDEMRMITDNSHTYKISMKTLYNINLDI